MPKDISSVVHFEIESEFRKGNIVASRHSIEYDFVYRLNRSEKVFHFMHSFMLSYCHYAIEVNGPDRRRKIFFSGLY